MGVFARGWLGLGVCATARVRLLVFACFGVCARLGVVGQSLSRRSCPGLLGWCSRSGVGLKSVCAAAACPMGGGWPCWGGTWLSRPIQRGAAHRPMRGEEGEKGWG